jgi:prolyl-tRNA synthetase
VSSYRDLPLNAYQMNTKFRDEIRPRFGVIRSKEFIMKDAYSFDMDEESLENSYQEMRQAYRRIFERCGLETIPVEADTGSMGGSDSEEFMVASEIGEEVLCICSSCGYRANQEKAEYRRKEPEKEEPLAMEEVETPAVSTIDDLTEFFRVDPSRFLKSLIYMADGKPVMAVVPGDRELNETKLKNALGAVECELADDRTIQEITGAPTGFAGPVLEGDIRIICDLAVSSMTNAITGANKQDYHLKNVNPGRDFQVRQESDITSAEEGDPCPKCETAMGLTRGIEVGHIFKLGDKYTKSMGMTVLDEQGREVTPIMGCYGIGVNRTLAAIVEQHNDERGIIWPESVSPYQVHLVGIAKSDEEWEKVDSVYEDLVKAGFDVIYDDRQVSPGIKFADADLMGIPWRVTAGKTFFAEDRVEIKARGEKDFTAVSTSGLVHKLQRRFRVEK